MAHLFCFLVHEGASEVVVNSPPHSSGGFHRSGIAVSTSGSLSVGPCNATPDSLGSRSGMATVISFYSKVIFVFFCISP